MIKKINKIQNIGLFENCISHNEAAFAELTMIYAENGQGKTTLSTILRSLSTNDTRPIQERKTLGEDGESFASINIAGTSVNYENAQWNTRIPNLEIFDSIFVDENIYAGNIVEHAHKKNLYGFVIGQDQIILRQEIENIGIDVKRINDEIDEIKTQIRHHIISKMDIDAFIKINRVDDIQVMIDDMKRKIQALQQVDEVQRKSELSILSLPEIPFDEITYILGRRFEDIPIEVENRMREHIKEYMDEKGESWISQGMQYLKGDSCPFCAQILRDTKMIELYRSYFNESYSQFKDAIKEKLLLIQQLLSEDALVSFLSKIKSNELLYQFWHNHIDSCTIDISSEQSQENWKLIRSILSNQLGLKLVSPVDVIDTSKELRDPSEIFSDLQRTIKAYNDSIEKLNSSIRAKKQEIGESNLADEKDELEQLQNVQKRYEPEVDSLCRHYAEKKRKVGLLGRQKGKKWEKLDGLTDRLISKYEEKINFYLDRFGSGFRIGSVAEMHSGGKPSINWCIKIRNTEVPLSPRDDSKPAPCFKNTLSSGDRSTLAFAFFLARLARLEHDQNLGDRIIVIDDPLSSLDDHRKTCTWQEIIALATKAEQVIVLSHDPSFLKSLWDDARSLDKTALQIRPWNLSNTIVKWNIEEATLKDYERDIQTLSEFNEHPEPDERLNAIRSIRPVLEHWLYIQHPDRFGGRMLGQMIQEIEKATGDDPLISMKPLTVELSQINDFTKKHHHGASRPSNASLPNTTEVKTYVWRTLVFIGK